MASFEIDGLVFRSNFDSGNLAKIIQLGNMDFAIWTKNDCHGTPFQSTGSSWFYFAVSGTKKGQVLRFVVNNLNNHKKLYKFGMRPCYRTSISHPQWERVKEPCTILSNESEPFCMSFKHLVEQSDEEIFFAMCFPFSYGECQEYLHSLEAKHRRSQSLYFHRENLIYSLEGRRLDMLTISSHKGITTSREEYVDNCFPDKKERPFTFSNKPIYFLTARVHPGETPGSHACNGFIDFILSEEDKRAKVLRDNFVFKIIPMLNPDGVYNGHYRADTKGENLNRVYTCPSLELHPTIFATKVILHQLWKTGNLHIYLDLHAHASKRGCFIYGNSLNTVEDQTNNVVYARLLSVNSQHFDFNGCNFSEKNMVSKDKLGQSKEGAGRVAFYTETGMLHCYTLECNYCTGKFVNPYIPMVNMENPTAPITQVVPDLKPVRQAPKYTPEVFADIGKAMAVSVLDMHELNPYSRLPKTPYKNFAGIKDWVYKFISKKPKYCNSVVAEIKKQQAQKVTST